MRELHIYLDDPWDETECCDPTCPGAISIEGPYHIRQLKGSKAFGASGEVTHYLVAYVAATVTVDVLSSCICNLLTNHGTKRVRIEHQDAIEVDRGKLRLALRKELEKEE